MNTRNISSSLLATQICLLAFVLWTSSGLQARSDNTAPSTPASSPSTATPASPRLRYRIVVDQGKWDEIRSQYWNSNTDIGDGIQAQLVDKLQKSGYFIVLEREATAVAQDQNEDQVDATKRDSLPTGSTQITPREQRTAANYVITPSVIGYQETSGSNSGGSLGFLNVGGKKSKATLTLNIRISDAQTGEIVATQTAMGEADSKSSGVGVNLGIASVGNQQFENSPAGQAVDQALDSAVAQIVTCLSAKPWTASVAAQDPDTKRVIINAGGMAGVAVGQVFDVFKRGAPVLDPDTGEVISTGDDVKIGRISVQRVQDKASYCNVIAGTLFKPGEIVKPAT